MMIEFENITKFYGSHKALDSLNFSIEENEIFGLVGGVGSGKTTAMKILSGLLPPTSGSCRIHGLETTEKSHLIKPMIGYVPDFIGVYENLKIHEYMSFFAAAYGLTGNKKEEKSLEILEILGLENSLEKFVEELSLTKKKKLCIARALIHDPQILLLDEPFLGLTLHKRAELIEILKQLNSLGITIVITTHSLREARNLCSGVAVFEEGRLVVSGCMSEIEKRIQEGNPIVMKVKERQELAIQILKEDERVKNLIISEEDEMIVQFTGKPAEEAELLRKIVMAGVLVSSFSRKGYEMESML